MALHCQPKLAGNDKIIKRKELIKMLKEKLNNLKKETTNELEIYVIDYVLKDYNDDEEIKMFFKDLLQISGCQGGMIKTLIYYKDTQAFYDKYYNEIEELREELEESLGESLKVENDLKNWYAWLGFEETARKIAEKIGLEI